MLIEPKVRGFICTSAHPLGCKEHVQSQINYIKEKGPLNGPKNVLVIGSSTGYGLASRIAATYGFSANTIGVMFEKPASAKRTATAGWYNTAAFEEIASSDGYYATSINGDAFSTSVKDETIARIKQDLQTIDLVIYSLAAPRRTMEDGTVYSSVLKTTNSVFTNKSLDLRSNTITEASIAPATEEEITSTVKVMGGEDWFDWMKALDQAGVLSPNATTVAYSYIGPELTYPVYFEGTIGKAKEHLYQTSLQMNEYFKEKGIHSYISVNKALVTQASSAIPIVPLYMAILYKVMKEYDLHENCIMQIDRMFREKGLFTTPVTDEQGRLRLDDYELRPEIQSAVLEIWDRVDTDTLMDYADIDGYWEDFYHMFGFHMDSVDYSNECDPDVSIPSLI